MSDAILYYFDGRGKGEIIRFMFAAAGIKFKEIFLKQREEFTKLIDDGLLDFKQLPLVSIDGFTCVQTGAIVRYLARKGGLYGKTDKDATLIDKFYEGSRDFLTGFLPIGFKDRTEVLKTTKETVLPRYLPAYEKALKNNGTGYLVGNSLSMADVGLYEALSNTVENFGPESIKDYPNLQQFYKAVTNLPRISEFLKGPQRQRANDERYVTEVKRVLAW